MMEFLTTDNNFWFSLALAIMIGLLLLELLTMMLGASLSGLIDNILPDINSDLEVSGTGISSKLLGWFYIDKVPALIALIIFLLIFGLLGLMTQTITNKFLNLLIESWIITPLVLLISIPISAGINRVFSVLVPTEETTAVTTDSFIGKVAIITQGIAKFGLPAEAKLKDEHGQTHYVRVEPENKLDEFTKGTSVILFDKKVDSSVFVVNRFDH